MGTKTKVVVDTYGCGLHNSSGNGPATYEANGTIMTKRCDCRYVRPAYPGERIGNLARHESFQTEDANA